MDSCGPALTRGDYIFLAKAAEQAERYEEMLEWTTELTGFGTWNQTYFALALDCPLPCIRALAVFYPANLTTEERNLFSVAARNVVGALRASWRILSSLAQAGPAEAAVRRVAGEAAAASDSVLAILERLLAVGSGGVEAQLFWEKMAGDHCRYLAELGRADGGRRALQHYEAAQALAAGGLHPCHPVRLGLALSWAVFSYEVLAQPDRALALAAEAFNGALAHLDRLEEADYRDSTLILQLLRENLTLWQEGEQQDPGPEQAEAQ